ncbi:uncharacterized protein LOC130803524 isoform X2 [Amaranthus tricolor]|uniref:uncharacterized protein LOC130803524 isoform X2 n=1 Tax=Amaranthus tricolor TaxID=29722 RepID=UPI002582A06F|nr:uncharacterized protein LOC130803524 isoform X2 [Amaranthus tricolor]XP_057523648.1 uncharacterized protein LOC130803524 isoform X2 [Amaranthus tricolor]XP_057523649.1 uncharacterized protein LOC130803524 isoform X2 [Amaranthus tricolor]
MSFKGTQQKCKVCDKTVCLMDQLSADGVAYHKSCFNVITAKASFSSKRKATSTPSVSTIPSVSNYNYELNYPEGYDQGLHDYAKEVEREIHIEDEEEEPTTPIGILRSRQSSTESHEVQQQQQRQARGKQVNFQSIDGGTGYFYKHLAKKHEIIKETHAASGSGTTSGSRQWRMDIFGGARSEREAKDNTRWQEKPYTVCRSD